MPRLDHLGLPPVADYPWEGRRTQPRVQHPRDHLVWEERQARPSRNDPGKVLCRLARPRKGF
jgi:hypothetical protein